jgi:ribosomal protein S18 acetylase RimI-like enzyme
MSAEFDLPFPHYRCPSCGKDLPLGEAHMTVTCGDHTPREDRSFTVRRASDEDRAAVETICDRALGETIVDVFGKTFDVASGVNLIAEVEGELGGLLSLVVSGGEATVVFLSVYPEHQGTGAGAALLDAADAFAAERGLAFLRAAVTNDDIPLLYFYQRHGFSIYDVRVGEVADRFGAATPGFSLIPVRDEFRLRRAVCGC